MDRRCSPPRRPAYGGDKPADPTDRWLDRRFASGNYRHNAVLEKQIEKQSLEDAGIGNLARPSAAHKEYLAGREGRMAHFQNEVQRRIDDEATLVRFLVSIRHAILLFEQALTIH